ncbi:MAG TPA: tetratricopeptide repeat protein [Longimicrobiales bacterium]|nr:tetratricopeptide repeat protein [Longimicrobiales bacterium]
MSLVGAVLVFASLAYATRELVRVEAQREAAVEELARLDQAVAGLSENLASVESELLGARCALSRSRAAINAFHTGSYRLAVDLYDEALQCDPGNAYLLNLKAYSLFKSGNVSEALTTQRLSVEADPDYAWGYFDLARFLCALGDFEDAQRTFDDAVSLRPGMVEIAAGDPEFRALCRGRVSG